MHHASGAFSFILLLHHRTANLLLLTILIIKCTGNSSGVSTWMMSSSILCW